MISIIVPAHNESAVIGRCLDALADLRSECEIVVVCNGCTDNTAARVRAGYPNVHVIETEVASKPNALNIAERVTTGFPRIYLDADVVLPAESLLRLVEHLDAGKGLATAPHVRWNLGDASWAVRAFYKVDGQLPSSREGIGGSGVYALSLEGRRRFEEFPDITADDTFVRRHFKPSERATVEDAYSVVTPPKTLGGVITIKTRSHYGNYEIAARFPHLNGNRGESNRRTLSRLMFHINLWPALAVYLFVKATAKTRAFWRFHAKRNPGWERDETSRTAPADDVTESPDPECEIKTLQSAQRR